MLGTSNFYQTKTRPRPDFWTLVHLELVQVLRFHLKFDLSQTELPKNHNRTWACFKYIFYVVWVLPLPPSFVSTCGVVLREHVQH